MIIDTNSDAYRKLRAKFTDGLPRNTAAGDFELLFKNFLNQNGACINYFKAHKRELEYCTDYLGIIPGLDEIVVKEEHATWFALKWL